MVVQPAAAGALVGTSPLISIIMSQSKRTSLPSRDKICDYWDGDSRLEGRIFNDACWMCGMVSSKLQRCHILPRCDGGSDDASNLHLLCPGCHQRTEFLSGDAYWAVFDVIKHDLIGALVSQFMITLPEMVKHRNEFSSDIQAFLDEILASCDI